MATEATTKQAQRQSPRWQPLGSKPVRVGLGPAGAGQLVDISAGGLRVQSLAPLRREAEVPLRLEIPDHAEPLQVSGVVVWSKPNGAAGIRFANLAGNQKQVLQAWLADLEKAALSPMRREDDEFTRVVSRVRAAKLNNADALNLIVTRITEATSASGAAIALGTSENMVCLAAAGVAPEIGTSIPSGVGLTGECVRRRKMVHCQNAQNDPRIGRELNLGSAVVLPLLVNGELRGVLEAVSLSVYAFDSNAIDTLERLADAIVFLTFGVVPQRRIAVVTPLTPSSTTRLSLTGSFKSLSVRPDSAVPTAPSVPVQPPAAPVNKPAPAVATFPLPATPKPQPVVTTPPKPVPVVAKPVAVQKPATPSAPVSVMADPVNIEELDSVARRVPARYLESYEPRQESSAKKWIVAAAAVIVFAAIPSYVWRQKIFGGNANPQPANSGVVATQPVQSDPQTVPNAAVPEVSQQAVASTPAPAVVPPAAAKPAPSPKVSEPTAKDAQRQTATEKPKPEPQAEPIMLAESGSIRRPVADHADDPAPAAPQFTVSPSAPQLALPANSVVPKLSAPVAKVRTGGTVVKQITPVYPQIAKAMHLEGLVELQIKVGKDGSVLSARRLSGHNVLANAAIDAVKRWRYDPFRIDGEPVDMETTVKLNFNAPR